MSTKQDATINRPDGDRLIDAPFVITDLERFATQLKTEEAWAKKDLNSITIYKTKGVTIVLTCMHEGAVISNNTIGGLVTVQVLEGGIDFIIEERSFVLEKNQMITLHPDMLHTIHARQESVLLLINSIG